MTGKSIRIVNATTQRALLPTFPGWGVPAEEYLPHMRSVELYETGTITGVESHGANPWTRYTIVLADGSRMSGVDPVNVEVL